MQRILIFVIWSVVLSSDVVGTQGGSRTEKLNDEIRSPVYAGGSASVPSGSIATLDVLDDRVMKVTWKGGAWELPYNQIQTVYVSLSRPSAMVELAAISSLFMFGALKGRKSYMSIRWEEPDGSSKTCYFYVPKGSAEIVETLARKSNRGVVFESHEAKRNLHARK